MKENGFKLTEERSRTFTDADYTDDIALLTDKMKRIFFQAAVVSTLLYGCTT